MKSPGTDFGEISARARGDVAVVSLSGDSVKRHTLGYGVAAAVAILTDEPHPLADSHHFEYLM